MVERAVREVATEALTEADFVRLCTSRGLNLAPFITPQGEVTGYTAATTHVATADQRVYSGRKLARDLSLRALRSVWDEYDDFPEGAWATWMALCPDVLGASEAPEKRRDGRWRWTLAPDGEPSPTSPSPADVSRRTVRAYLAWAQNGQCAMCSIRRFHWAVAHGGPPPSALVGPGEHLDHDHDTGLVRGLLCIPCNTYREVVGTSSREPVWTQYVTDPPAKDLVVTY